MIIVRPVKAFMNNQSCQIQMNQEIIFLGIFHWMVIEWSEAISFPQCQSQRLIFHRERSDLMLSA